jgi:DNA-directed RNA polymerase subunit RPC12/RpoP
MSYTAHDCPDCGGIILTDDGEEYECEDCGAEFFGHIYHYEEGGWSYIIEGRVSGLTPA